MRNDHRKTTAYYGEDEDPRLGRDTLDMGLFGDTKDLGSFGDTRDLGDMDLTGEFSGGFYPQDRSQGSDQRGRDEGLDGGLWEENGVGEETAFIEDLLEDIELPDLTETEEPQYRKHVTGDREHTDRRREYLPHDRAHEEEYGAYADASGEYTIEHRKSGVFRRILMILLVTAVAAAAGCGTLKAGNYFMEKEDLRYSSQMGQVYVPEEAIPVPVEVPEEQNEETEEETLPEPEEISYATASDNIRKLQDGTYRVHTVEGTPVTFTFAGDILFDERYAVGAAALARGGDISSMFDEATLRIMRDSDVFVVNNEFPYSTGGTPTADKQYTFRADPDKEEWLLDMGVDVAALANNHAYDYGEEALLSTIDTLDERSILHMGAGRDLAEAESPLYFRLGDYTVALINSTQIERLDNPDTRGAGEDSAGVFRCFDDTELLRVIAEAKNTADYCIVMIHWGTEKETQPDSLQTERLASMKEAGADLIVGGHSHCLQPVTAYDGMYVEYSLGNFLFTSYDVDTGVLRVTFDPESRTMESLQFVPMLQTGCTVKTLEGTEKERILGNLRSWSSGVVIDENGYITAE